MHHTGNMYQALENAERLVADQGILFISIYNDQGRASKMWRAVKRAYSSSPKALRGFILFPCFIRLWGPTTIKDILKGRPFFTWRTYIKQRGMFPFRDVIDWVGGHGCNQFVFKKA